MATYDIGDQVRLSVVVANSSGVATDPTALTLTVKPHDSTATTYTYAGGDITKDSTGHYHKDITITGHNGGTWYYKWVATGAAVGMEPGSFNVRLDDTV